MGYALAFISSIFFTLYIIPRRFSDLPILFFSLLVGVGFFVSSVVLYLFQPLLNFHETWSPLLLWAIPAGMMWAIGLVLLVKAIDSIGFARSNQWKNLQGPIGIILCLIVLSEYAATNPLFALLAGVAVFLSAMAFTISRSKAEAKTNVRGVYLAALSGLAFGAVTVINKYLTNEVGVYSQQIVWSAAIMLSIFVYIACQRGMIGRLKNIDSKNAVLGLGAGVLYLGASFFMLQSYNHIPASIGFTIIQLNAIWTVAIGIFLFKEMDGKKHYKRITAGFLLATMGILLLALAIK